MLLKAFELMFGFSMVFCVLTGDCRFVVHTDTERHQSARFQTKEVDVVNAAFQSLLHCKLP